jgi:hypothetical protein
LAEDVVGSFCVLESEVCNDEEPADEIGEVADDVVVVAGDFPDSARDFPP